MTSTILIQQRVYHRLLKEIAQIKFFQVPAEQAYQKSLKEYASYLPAISAPDSAIVDTLKQEGVFVTSLANLAIPSTSELFHASQTIIPKLLAAPSTNKREYVLKATSTQLMEHPSLFLWGLEERLLNIVENYLGLPVAYHGLYMRRDLANGVQRRTRLWHLDKEDRRMLKIIIYLEDVNHDGGPFQYIPKSLTPTISRSLKYNYDTIKDKVMERVVPPSRWKSCVGPAGTVLLIDPASMFHRGKLPVGSDRLTLFFDYTSRKPKHPYYCKSSFSVNESSFLANDLSQRQKECLFWSHKLWQEYQHKLNINGSSVPVMQKFTTATL